MKALIAAGANVNASDKNNETALMHAAERNNPDVIKVLIDSGAKVNAKAEKGVTALMYAAYTNTDPDVVKALIDAEAKVNVGDNYGRKPIFYLEHRKDKEKFYGTEAYWQMNSMLQ